MVTTTSPWMSEWAGTASKAGASRSSSRHQAGRSALTRGSVSVSGWRLPHQVSSSSPCSPALGTNALDGAGLAARVSCRRAIWWARAVASCRCQSVARVGPGPGHRSRSARRRSSLRLLAAQSVLPSRRAAHRPRRHPGCVGRCRCRSGAGCPLPHLIITGEGAANGGTDTAVRLVSGGCPRATVHRPSPKASHEHSLTADFAAAGAVLPTDAAVRAAASSKEVGTILIPPVSEPPCSRLWASWAGG